MNSIAVGVQTPLINRSNNFVKPAPLPVKLNCFINTGMANNNNNHNNIV
jgi:hypothetical protein